MLRKWREKKGAGKNREGIRSVMQKISLKGEEMK